MKHNYIKFNNNFHSSVNLFLDYNDNGKAEKFIETRANSQILELLNYSLHSNSGNHANILVGPYGKGKSHLVLRFLHNNTDYFPVIINGNNKDLQTQFRNALEISLVQKYGNKFFAGKRLPKDTIEIYNTAAAKIENYKYKGIIVVFDEFSKYLEQAKKIDTKFLQDFAEMCNRSPNLNLLLITHKALSNYDSNHELSKVEGRFNEIGLHNNFDTSYELISKTFEYDKKSLKTSFLSQFGKEIFDEPLFNRAFPKQSSEELKLLFFNLYPLHPFTAFLLPRISEIVAQNERTMFTFLSSTQKHSLYDFMKTRARGEILTPDFIFDYFEDQFRKAEVGSEIHELYAIVSVIGTTLPEKSLRLKIVKTICLIYISGYFGQVPPTYDVLRTIYNDDVEKFDKAITKLRNDNNVVYESHNDGYLSLHQFSGINISNEIQTTKLRIRDDNVALNTLNCILQNQLIYPLKHNDDNFVSRYFTVKFSDDIKSEYEIIPQKEGGKTCGEIYLKYDKSIDDELITISAIDQLLNRANESGIYKVELEFIRADYIKTIDTYIQRVLSLHNYSKITSERCNKWYANYFRYNYELVNRNNLTGVTRKARRAVIEVLLNNNHPLNSSKDSDDVNKSSPDTWTMQEKMLFWTFKKALLDDKNGPNRFKNIAKVIQREGINNFGDVYQVLQSVSGKIGLMKGVVPLFVGEVFRELTKNRGTVGRNVIIREINSSKVLSRELDLNAGLFDIIDENPKRYTYEFIDNSRFDVTLKELASALERYYIGDFENPTPHLVGEAINRWYYSIPNLSRTGLCHENQAYQALFTAISKPINHPTEFLNNQFLKLISSIGKELPEVVDETISLLNQKYAEVADELGVEQNEVDKLVKSHTGLKLRDLDYITYSEFINSDRNGTSKNSVDLKLSDLKQFAGKARLLSNEISTALKDMHTAISRAEKIEVLEEMLKGVRSGIL